MRSAKYPRAVFLIGALTFLQYAALLPGQSNSGASNRIRQDSAGDGQHDFDFEFGAWKAHLKRSVHPLTGPEKWVDLEGTSTVRKIWNGRANLGELELDNGKTHIEGLSLRLYNPESRQWSVYWANSKDGSLGTPMIGRFKDGRGEFFDQEIFEGTAVYVRFVFSDVTQDSFRFEQAFSIDGGKTWAPNWICAFTRQRR